MPSRTNRYSQMAYVMLLLGLAIIVVGPLMPTEAERLAIVESVPITVCDDDGNCSEPPQLDGASLLFVRDGKAVYFPWPSQGTVFLLGVLALVVGVFLLFPLPVLSQAAGRLGRGRSSPVLQTDTTDQSGSPQPATQVALPEDFSGIQVISYSRRSEAYRYLKSRLGPGDQAVVLYPATWGTREIDTFYTQIQQALAPLALDIVRPVTDKVALRWTLINFQWGKTKILMTFDLPRQLYAQTNPRFRALLIEAPSAYTAAQLDTFRQVLAALPGNRYLIKIT